MGAQSSSAARHPHPGLNAPGISSAAPSPRAHRIKCGVADITYVRTDVGWVYVGFVLDVLSRMILVWQTSTRMFADLAIDALAMGLWLRRRAGRDITGLIDHSDRGVEYRAIR